MVIWYWGQKPPTLNPVALGKMAFVKALTGPLETTIQDEEIFYSLKEAKIIIGEWVKQITKGNSFRGNYVRPHSALGYRQPVPQN